MCVGPRVVAGAEAQGAPGEASGVLTEQPAGEGGTSEILHGIVNPCGLLVSARRDWTRSGKLSGLLNTEGPPLAGEAPELEVVRGWENIGGNTL